MTALPLRPPLDFEPHVRKGLFSGRWYIVLYNHEYERWFVAARTDTYYSAYNVMNVHRNRHRLAMISRQRAERESLHLRHLAERKQPQ